MRFAELDAVTVDGYGTIVRLLDPVPSLVRSLAERGIDRDPELVRTAFLAEVAYYRPEAVRGRDPESLARLRCDCTGVFLDAAGVGLEPESFVGDFMAAIRFEAVPGAVEMLDRLRGRGLDLAVVSNWDVGLTEHLERIGADRLGPRGVPAGARAAGGRARPRTARRGRERGRAGSCGGRNAIRAGAAGDGIRGLVGVTVLRSGKLTAWVILVAVLALLGYASRAAGGKPPKDAAYQYSTAAGGLVQYAIILAVVLAIARPDWSLLALRRPRAWAQTLGAVALVFLAVYATSAVVSAFGDPGREQGLTPTSWDSSRAVPFAVNFVVFVAVAPFVEELTFRGLGYSLLEPLGRLTAILWVGVAFGLAHGLLEGLPILIVFGCGLAWLRERSDSVYPGMVVHGIFNAVALIVAVST
jgi:membrane protease YdiL (CAAX protease family)